MYLITSSRQRANLVVGTLHRIIITIIIIIEKAASTCLQCHGAAPAAAPIEWHISGEGTRRQHIRERECCNSHCRSHRRRNFNLQHYPRRWWQCFVTVCGVGSGRRTLGIKGRVVAVGHADGSRGISALWPAARPPSMARVVAGVLESQCIVRRCTQSGLSLLSRLPKLTVPIVRHRLMKARTDATHFLTLSSLCHKY